MSGTLTAVAHTATRRVRDRGLDVPLVAYGKCVIETSVLVRTHNAGEDFGLVHAVQVTGQNYPGREHWAAILWEDAEDPADAVVVDPTLRQFLPEQPAPWVGPLIEWYDLMCDALGDWINVAVHAPDYSTPDGLDHDPHWTDSYARDEDEPPTQPPYPWNREETP